jgi:hypothetical protein
MTVCTNHVAGVDLIEHSLPATVAKTNGDVEVLVPQMVELEHERIGLATVDAGPLTKEFDEIGGALGDEHSFSAYSVRNVALAVCRIVLPFVSGSASAAVVVPLPTRPSTPGKVRDRPELPAATAGLVESGRYACHEHMFV